VQELTRPTARPGFDFSTHPRNKFTLSTEEQSEENVNRTFYKIIELIISNMKGVIIKCTKNSRNSL